MSDSKQPQEPENTIFQRNKTAKEPPTAATEVGTKSKPKPKPKPRKAFVPKKLIKVSGKPQEYRVRHIRVSTLESANLFRQTLIDFQNELSAEATEDPDKPFHDRQKVEQYFSRIAKKYSTCSTRLLGGDLDWVHEGMGVQEETTTPELINTMTKTENHVIPEPIKTRLGHHIILVCEIRDKVEKEKPKAPPKPKSAPAGTNIPT